MAAVVEIDALIRALAGCRGHAERQLARRQAALLATLAPPIGGDGERTIAVELDGGVVEVPLLALVGLRPHRVAELAFEMTCLFEQVETAGGPRFGVRPLGHVPAGARTHRIEIVVGDHAQLRVDGRTLRSLRVAEAANEPHAREIPRAQVLLLSAADAAQLTMDPPARAEDEREPPSEARAVVVAREPEPAPSEPVVEESAGPVAASEASAVAPVERAAPEQLSLWTDDELAIVPLPPRVAEQLSLWSDDGYVRDGGAEDSDEPEVSFAVGAEPSQRLLPPIEPGQRDVSLLIVVDEPGDLRMLDAGEPGDLRALDGSERPPMSFEELIDGLIDETTADVVGRRVPRTRLRRVDDSELIIEVVDEDSFEIQVDEEKS